MNTQDFSINRWIRSTRGQIFLMFLLISAVYLITEHTAHVLGVLPYALLLLCPLLHLFMHSGHGDHAGHSSQSPRDIGLDSPQSQRDSKSDHQGHVH